MERIEITLEELYQIVGELEVTKRKQQFQIHSLLNQLSEINLELVRLREKNGQLDKANNH